METQHIAFAVAFTAFGVYAVILLAKSDWIPGGIILAAALVGLALQIPAIREQRRGSRQ